MANKGQIHVTELVFAILLVVVSLYAFFPENLRLSSSWQIIKPKIEIYDFLSSSDKIKYLPKFLKNVSSEIQKLNLDFIAGKTFVLNNYPRSIQISCNCSNSTINLLSNATLNHLINSEKITFYFCQTHLESLNPCLGSSRILIIENLPGNNYYNFLQNLIENKYSLILYVDPNTNFNNNDIANKIFGINNSSRTSTLQNLTFDNSKIFLINNYNEEIYKNSYNIYKNFFGIVISLPTSLTEFVSNCVNIRAGLIYIYNSSYRHKFLICNSSHAYIDLNRNGNFESNEIFKAGDSLKFLGFKSNVTLVYIDNKTFTIGIKFDFYNNEFSDITNFANVFPIDNNNYRKVLVRSDGVAGLIVNTTRGKHVFFPKLNDFSEDKKALLVATLFWLAQRIENEKFFTNYFTYDYNYTFIPYEIVVN